MKNKTHIWQSFVGNKWFRLGASALLAFVLTGLALFLPAIANTSLHLSVPSLREGKTVDLSMPLDAGTVYAANGLTITKSATPIDFVDQGAFLTYTLVITNETAGSLAALIVSDPVPLNASCAITDGGQIFNTPATATQEEWSGQQSSCNEGTARWVYLAGNDDEKFDNGETVELRYRVMVAEPLRDQVDKIINQANYQVEVIDTSSTITGQTSVTNIVNAPLWQISKSVNPTPTIQPGDFLTYTLKITNSGHLTTSGNYTVTDLLPDHTDFITATPTPVFTDPAVTWVFTDEVGIDQSRTLTYAVQVTLPLTDGIQIVNQTYNITGGTVFSQADGTPISVTVNSPVTMTVTKSDAPDPVQAGELLNYTITVTNENSSKGPADDVVVTDTLPANTTFDNAGFGGGTEGITATNGITVSWTITNPNPLPVGEAVSMTLTVRVTTPLTNNTIITNDTYTATTDNSISTVAPAPAVTTTVESSPVLSVTKEGLPQLVKAGEQLTYTIRYSNTGNANATNVTISDTFPISTNYATDESNPPINSTPITGGRVWTVPTVAGEGGNGVITLTLNVEAPQADGTVLTNVVSITSTEVMTPALFTETNIINSSPVLSITKRGLSEPVAAGGQLTYTIRYTNSGNADATDVLISDTFPISTNYATDVSNPDVSPGTLTTNGITWTIPTVAGLGGSGVITLTLNVDEPQDPGTVLTNVVSMTATEVANLVAFTATNTITSTPVLTISKVGSPEPVAAGGQLTYTIRYTNTGNADATNVTISDTFPISTNYATDISNPDISPGTPITGGMVWTAPTVAGSGGGGVITLTLDVDEPQDPGTVLTNVVSISATNAITPSMFTATNTITSTPDLSISKGASSNPIDAGSVLTYTIFYTNTGNADATNVIITDTYEGAFETITGTLADLSSVSTSPSPAELVWTISRLPADSVPRTKIVTVTLPVSLAEGTILTNSVTITSAQAVTASDTITTEVRALRADLQLGKTANITELFAGQPITYTLTITNNGPDTVGVVVTDTFDPPSGASFTDCSDSCINASNAITWNNLPLLDPGVTQTLVLTLTPNGLFSGTLTNTGGITFSTIYSSSIDPGPGPNTDSVTTTVRRPNADLQINKVRVGSGDVIAGDLITYTINITSGTGSDTVDAVVTDSFPAAAVQTVESCSSCNQGSGVLTWTVSNFAADDTQSFTVVLRTSATYSGPLTNTVGITFSAAFSNAIDPDSGNNTDTVIDTVRLRQANLSVNKTYMGDSEVVIGNPITYTLAITNAGPDIVTAIVTDTLNKNMSLDSFASPYPGTTCNSTALNEVQCTVPSFTGTTVITLVLDTTNAATGTVMNGVQITPDAALETDNSDNDDSIFAPDLRPPQAELEIVKTLVSSDTILINDLITYTLTVSNNGPDTVDVTVTDTFTNASLDSSAGASCNGSGPLVCNLASFTGTTVITVVLDTSSSISGTVANTAEVTPTNDAVVDNVSGNNSSDAPPVTVSGVTQLVINKTAVPASGQDVRPEQTIRYNLEVTNLSTATFAATNLVLTDTLDPTSVNYVTGSTSTPGASGPFQNGNVITFSIASLGIGSSLEATVEVTVTKSAISGTIINNSATAYSDQTGQIGPATTTHRVITSTNEIFLPIILKNFAPKPDLTITNFEISPADPSSSDNVVVSITIENIGAAATTEGFWVDFYIEPNPVPDHTMGERRWEKLGSNVSPKKGIAWKITSFLDPGESLTLTSNGAAGTIGPDPGFASEWLADPTFVPGTDLLYAFVDSFDEALIPEGEIDESDETNNRDEINLPGRGVTGTSAPAAPGDSVTSEKTRPDLGN